MMRQRLVALCIAIVGVVGVVAFGASASSSASSAAPITLMTMGPISSPEFSEPSIPVGAQIAVNEINSAGGVNGHKLKLISCNDSNTPVGAQQCTREAIADKVTALVGGLEDYDLQVDPLLVQAGIPWVGLVTPDDYHSSNLFLFGGEGADVFAASAMALAEHGCKHIAAIASASAGTQNVNLEALDAGIHAEGLTVAGNFTVPATAVDFTSTVAAVRAAGADCIASGTSPVQSGPLISAISTGAPLKVGVAVGGLPPTVLKQLGTVANGTLATSGFLPPTSTVPAVQKLAAQVAKYPNVPYDQFATTGYASVEIVAHVLKSLKKDTAAALMAALPKVNKFNTGIGPVVTFGKSSGIKGFSRLFDYTDYVYVANNGVYDLASPKDINTLPALKLVPGL